MASGLPDYFRGIDIAFQALAQVTNRPKYGSPTASAGIKVTTASGRNTLLTVSGKGMLYGGLVFLNHTLSQKDAEVILVIDGSDMVSLQFDDMNLLGVNKVGVYPTTLLMYDDAAYIYCVGLGYGITFETSLSVVYNETNGSTPTVFSHVVYAII